MKILFLVSTLRQAGPTMQLLNVLRHLDRNRFDPVVVTLSAEPSDSMQNSFADLGVPVRSLGLSRVRGFFHRRWREDILRLAGVEAGGHCVIHSQGIRADVISARAFAGLPRVATARNYPYDDYVMKYGRIPGRLFARRHMRAFRSVSVVVACSSTLAGMLRRHGLAPVVIRNGVDASSFRHARPAERAELRAGLGLAANDRVGVCVGSLVNRKNPAGVVRAVRVVESPALAMIFVGTGSLENECRRAAAGDARIRFAGQVDDVLRYLQAADFFVSASRSEGMPNAALEALACGLPVVLSNIEPHAELVRLLPASGILFDVDDVSALAAAIRLAASPNSTAEGPPPDVSADLLGAGRMSRSYQELYSSLGGPRD